MWVAWLGPPEHPSLISGTISHQHRCLHPQAPRPPALSPLEGGPGGPIHQGSGQAGRASYQCPEGVPRTCRPAEVLTIPTPQSRRPQSSTPQPSGTGAPGILDPHTLVGSGQALGKNGEATQRDQCPQCALVPPRPAGPSSQLS